MDMVTKYGNYQLALRERKELEALKKIFPLPFDHFYMIEVDGGDFEKACTVGVIATSDTEKAIYVEWIEIFIEFRSNGFFLSGNESFKEFISNKEYCLESSNEN